MSSKTFHSPNAYVLNKKPTVSSIYGRRSCLIYKFYGNKLRSVKIVLRRNFMLYNLGCQPGKVRALNLILEQTILHLIEVHDV